jgi:hypothetical protein
VALFRTTTPDSPEDLAKAIHVKADQGGDISGWLQDTLNAKANCTLTPLPVFLKTKADIISAMLYPMNSAL